VLIGLCINLMWPKIAAARRARGEARALV
jgi:hypothetical protein